jgi:Type III restriction enzyme, res subunit
MDDELDILELTEEKIERTKQIEIFPYQVEHFKKILSILQAELGYLDTSPFGAGKTILALAIASTFKMGILVIGPKTVLPNWKKQAKIYGIHVFGTLTYHSLRGTGKTGVKHDLLTRNENVFTPTNMLEKCSKYGLLIIYDECHHLKNENSQLAAGQTLSTEAARLAKAGHNVRIAALSATPADKKENITSIFKILGIITSSKLYKYDRSNKSYVLQGLQEAINKCNKYDSDTTFHIICRTVNKTTSKIICHELYNRVLKKIITSGMPEPPIEFKKNIKNLFALMPSEDVERMREGALLFSSATAYKPETKEIDTKSLNWGDIIRSRREIDSAKVNTMVRLTLEDLEENPKRKVVLFFTFKRDMHDAFEQLKKYNPLILNGDIVEDAKRTEIMNKFQKYDSEYRVLISNPVVGGEGIDLDDTHGDFPRSAYIAPNYMFIAQFQATGRFRRKNTKSEAKIRFIYSRDFPYENGILNSMIEKSYVARGMIQSNQNSIVFPGEIDQDIEKTSEELLEQKRDEEEVEN